VTVASARTFSSKVADFLNDLSAIGASQDAGAAMHFAVTRLPELLAADRAFIYLLSPDRKRLIVTHESDGADPSLLGLSQPLAQLPALTSQAVRSGQTVLVDDLARFPITDRQRRSLRFRGVTATIMTPFGVERKFAGLLVLDVFARPRQWEKTIVEAAARISARIGSLMTVSHRGGHMRADDPALETKSAQLNVLANLAHAFESSSDVHDVVQAVSDELGMIYGKESVEIATRDSKAEDLALREALATGKVLVRTDDTSTRYVVPLSVDAEIVGAIDLRASSRLSAEEGRFLETVARLSAAAMAKAERVTRMRDEAISDHLTGLFNHRFLIERYNDTFSQCKSAKRPLSLMLVDLDGLRQVNAKLGFGVGDETLKYVASQVRRALKDDWFAGRYGSEEFLVAMPGISVDDAGRTAKRLTDRIAEESPSDLPPATVSIGVVASPTHSSQADILLDLAEKAVYIAKYGGRNRIHVVNKNVNADWERLAMEAVMAVLTAKQFVAGPQAVEKAAERLAQAGTRNIDMALALAQAVDVRDKYTSGHSHAVSNYSVRLAKALLMSDAELEEVRLGALLHDVGKIGTPEQILGKNGPLTDEEFAIMRKHPEDGARILAPIPSMRRVSAIVEAHQEYYNGSGYPFKLAGDDIPRAARIVSIGDAYHAMVSTRPYRKGMSVEKACSILTDGAGSQWDPRFVETFVKVLSSTKGVKEGERP